MLGDTTLYPMYDQVSDLWQNIGLVSELEPELGYIVDWAGSGLLISMLEKLNLLYLTHLLTQVLLIRKCMGLFLKKIIF